MARHRRIPPWLNRNGCWLAVLVPLLMPLGWNMRHLPGLDTLFAWFSLLVLYVALPLLDLLIGRDRTNPERPDEPSSFEAAVPLSAGLSYVAVLGWALYTFSANPGWFDLMAALGWGMSLANLGGVVAINVAHELIHRRARGMRLVGGGLLSCVGYPGFKLEHPRWHHLHVATPRDPSSAPIGSTIYRQVPRALVLNTLRGWRLSASNAHGKGRLLPWLLHEMAYWYLLTAGLAVTVFVLLGWPALLMFIGHGLGAAVLLEVINYIEHYGLRRERRGDGGYERPRAAHSWESDFWLSNVLLLQLPRHPDHHLNPNRHFGRLQVRQGAPRLPFGYAALVIAALFPPLWRALIHPRLPVARG